MRSQETPQEAPLLEYSQRYWTGIDGQERLKLPDALFWKHYKAELKERGIAALTAEGAGRRAEAFRDCRKPAYWRQVKDPRLIRTPLVQEDSQTHQGGTDEDS